MMAKGQARQARPHRCRCRRMTLAIFDPFIRESYHSLSRVIRSSPSLDFSSFPSGQDFPFHLCRTPVKLEIHRLEVRWNRPGSIRSSSNYSHELSGQEKFLRQPRPFFLCIQLNQKTNYYTMLSALLHLSSFIHHLIQYHIKFLLMWKRENDEKRRLLFRETTTS